MPTCYIINAKRSPRALGKETGALHTISSLSLLSQVLNETVPQNIKPVVDDVIAGCVMPVGEQGANITRSALLHAGFPNQVPGMQINRFCSSGLDAVSLTAAKIIAGQSEVCLAGGVESMSRVPMMSDGGAILVDPDIAMTHHIVPQGISADLIATQSNYTRQQLDEFALRSHQLAVHAQTKGYLKSIVPIKHPSGIIALDKDEVPRNKTSMSQLSKLNPSFELLGKMAGYDDLALQAYPETQSISHLHHAGNSSAIADGAAGILLASNKAVNNFQLKPKAKIIAFDQVGIDPTIMLTGPALSIQRLLKKSRKKVSDIDLWEINEAFASVVLKCIDELSLDITKVNVNGGAIAYGHPLGATGAMLIGTMVDELIRQKKTYGIISLCTAAGMASSLLIERV